MGVYPFMFGTMKDFEGIVEAGTKVDMLNTLLLCCFTAHTIVSQAGLKEPYDWDKYADIFLPKGRELQEKAELAEIEGNKDKAYEYYM